MARGSSRHLGVADANAVGVENGALIVDRDDELQRPLGHVLAKWMPDRHIALRLCDGRFLALGPAGVRIARRQITGRKLPHRHIAPRDVAHRAVVKAVAETPEKLRIGGISLREHQQRRYACKQSRAACTRPRHTRNRTPCLTRHQRKISQRLAAVFRLSRPLNRAYRITVARG
jgi:hypothetical protein